VQCGIREVVYSLSYSVDSRSAEILIQGGVNLRQIRMPTRS
jgi:dCMP deaminase